MVNNIFLLLTPLEFISKTMEAGEWVGRNQEAIYKFPYAWKV